MAVSREGVVSRLSTGGGVKGGGGIEAEHWVQGEEGGVEGGDGVGVDIGVEAGKQRWHRRRGRD
jgi:hypothetical protein